MDGGKTFLFPGAETEPPKNDDEKKHRINLNFNAIVEGVIITLLATLILAILSEISNIHLMKKDIDDIKGTIKTMTEEAIPNVKSELTAEIQKNTEETDKDIRDIQANISTIEQSTNELRQLVYSNLNLHATPIYSQQVSIFLGQKNSFDDDNGEVLIERSVAYSSSGAEFTSQQLRDVPLLLPYNDETSNGYFYGQINEYNHWDGNCVVNTYKNGKLSLITDAEYDNGKLIKCIQIFPDFTTASKNGDRQAIWVLSNRIVEKDVRHGETWHYFRKDDYETFFEPENVTEETILTADKFIKWLNENNSNSDDYPIEGYYCGDTSNGYFNDDSGNAYLVKYFRNGFNRTVYVGTFKNGLFEDANAWMIGKNDESQTAYAYYEGPFKSGNYTGDRKCWTYNLTQEEIDSIIMSSGIPFKDGVLRWE